MNYLHCLFSTGQKTLKFDKNGNTKYLLYENPQKQLYILFNEYAETTFERKTFEGDLENTLLSYGYMDNCGKIIAEENYEQFDDISGLEGQIIKQRIYIPKVDL